jgi:hypothetical protein
MNDFSFIEEWKKQMKSTLMLMGYSEDKIDKKINEEVKKKLFNPQVNLVNSYTHENAESNLIDVYDYVKNNKVILAGNATVLMHQDTKQSINIKMIEFNAMKRGISKKKMYENISNIVKFRLHNNSQKTYKLKNNAYYGNNGSPTSVFYNEETAPAVTLTAQIVISSCFCVFEALLGNNHKFYDANDAVRWINVVLTEFKNLPSKIDNFVYEHEITENMLIDKLCKLFYKLNDTDVNIITKIVTGLSKEEIIFLYYKNNIKDFLKLSYVKKIIHDVLHNINYHDNIDKLEDADVSILETLENKNVKEYNKKVDDMAFINPYKVPVEIVDSVKEFTKVCMTYVYTAIMPINRRFRLKDKTRDSVIHVDTDSCIIQLDTIIDYIEDIKNDNIPNMSNIFIKINMLCYMMTDTVQDILYKYSVESGMAERYYKQLTMKNEFLWINFILGKVKKRYLAQVLLKEGAYLKGMHTEYKGFDFIKSGTSDDVYDFFDEIIKQHIINQSPPDVASVKNKLDDFINNITTSVGELLETKYLPLYRVAVAEAYKDPISMQQYRATTIWNTLYPEYKVLVPDTIYLLSLNIIEPSDIIDLKDIEPEIYTKLCDILESGSKLSEYKIRHLAIPQGMDIPEWCKPYIDTDDLLNKIIGPFKGVVDALGLTTLICGKDIRVKNENGKTKTIRKTYPKISTIINH